MYVTGLSIFAGSAILGAQIAAVALYVFFSPLRRQAKSATFQRNRFPRDTAKLSNFIKKKKQPSPRFSARERCTHQRTASIQTPAHKAPPHWRELTSGLGAIDLRVQRRVSSVPSGLFQEALGVNSFAELVAR